jgi:voltage-gated potassium channel
MFTMEHTTQPENFSSIAQAIWWAVVTLTTVGYGDITPITFGGKLLGIIIMLLGVGAMALPAGILAARFTEELASRREVMEGKVMEALKDGTLDADEAVAIERLQQELGLSTEEVRRIVSLQTKHMQRHNFCPHCGESLAE